MSGDINNFQFSGVVTVRLGNPADPLNPLALTIPAVSDIPRSVSSFGTYSTPGFPAVRSLTGTNSTGEIVYTSPALLALFNGPGTISLPTSGTIQFTCTADNDGGCVVTSRYNGTATIIYSYTANETPEPGTLAFLLGGGGLIALGIVRRRAA